MIKIFVTGFAISRPPGISGTGRDLKTNWEGDYITLEIIPLWGIDYLTLHILLCQDNLKSVHWMHRVLACYIFSYKLKRCSYNLGIMMVTVFCSLQKVRLQSQNSLNWQEFHRQGDSNTVDQHKLPVPVIARYLRFNPTQRHAWNCLRVEVYGTQRELLPLLTY